MIMLALQIFLLLLSAYLAGCMFGCFLRRALHTPKDVVDVPIEAAIVAAPRHTVSAESARFETALTGKLPSSVPLPVSDEPVVEVRPRPVAAPVAPVESRGYDAGTAQIEIIKAPPAPEPQVQEPVAEVPEPSAPIEVVEDPAPAPVMSGAAQMASYAAVAAAAAAARAAAEAEAAAQAPEPEPEPAVEPEPEPEPAPAPEVSLEPESDAAATLERESSTEAAESTNAAQDGVIEIVPVSIPDTAAPVTQSEPEPEPPVVEAVPEAAVAASGPADDLKRIRGIDDALEARLREFGVQRFADIASWSSEDVARMNQSLGLIGRIEQENWIEQADILARGSDTNYSRRQRVAATTTAVGMAAAAASAAANATAQKSAGPDRLTRIIGIDPETEQALYAMGVLRYSQIAQWSSADVERVEASLGRPGRVGLDNWIEQARVLARYAGETGEARPVRLVDAIRENREAKAAEPPPATRSDVAGLRSVRSQALRGDGPAPGDRVDDLKRIRGIGVLIEKRLNALGITSYEQIANWTKADSDSISAQLDFRGRIERENWIEQARILASGGQTEFSRRVDRGEVETSKDG
jgi:predicted flap endonuclease-1-like 5' DNA nuclease